MYVLYGIVKSISISSEITHNSLCIVQIVHVHIHLQRHIILYAYKTTISCIRLYKVKLRMIHKMYVQTTMQVFTEVIVL